MTSKAATPRVKLHTVSEQMVVVTLSGEHDISTVERLREALARAKHAPRVIVDLTPCSFLDFTIVGLLLASRDPGALDPRALEFVLPDDGSFVNRTLGMMAAREIVTFHESLPDARRDVPSLVGKAPCSPGESQ